MLALVRYVLTLALLLVAVTNAQSVFLTQYLTQVINGLDYPVSWEAGGAPVTLDLLKDGAYQETLYFEAGTTFTWNVEDDNYGGTNYTLMTTPLGNKALAFVQGTIWMIEDEDGLMVNGQVITVSISNVPTHSGQSSPAASISVAATDAGDTVTVVTMTAGPRTEAFTFSSTQCTYTFATTLTPTATNTSIADQTLTFVSMGRLSLRRPVLRLQVAQR